MRTLSRVSLAAVLPLFAWAAGCSHNHETQSTAQPVFYNGSPPPNQFETRPMEEPATPVERTSRQAQPLPRQRDNVTFTSQRREIRDSGMRQQVSLDSLRAHVLDGTAVFVDARKPDQFAAGHLRGALNLPSESKEANMGTIWQNVAKDQLIIIYCGGGSCHASDVVYDYLISNGFTQVREFKAGWEVLGNQRDLPIETGPAKR